MPSNTFTLSYDHACSDGAGGYGAVCVVTPDDSVFYLGRSFARTALVERFPAMGLTYDEAQDIIMFLWGAPTLQRRVQRAAVRS